MAIGKKTGGKDFEKGAKPGPGRPKLPGDIKAARVLNQIELERTLNDLIFSTEADLKAVRTKPGAAAIELVAAKIILVALQTGDHMRLEFLLNRLVGKVKEKVEIDDKRGIAERLAKARARREAKAKGAK